MDQFNPEDPRHAITLLHFSEYLDYVKYLEEELSNESNDAETDMILEEDYKEAITTLKALKDDCKEVLLDYLAYFKDNDLPINLDYYRLLKIINEFEKVNKHVLR
jgi:adenylate kinase family enzyme